MKQVCSLLKSLAIATAASTIAFANPAAAQKATMATAANFDLNFAPIEIPVPLPEKRHGICSDFLRPEIDTILKKYDSKWAILVQTLNGTTLYYYNADLKLIPASNIKILTTAAALQRLAPTSKIGSKSLQEWIEITNLKSNNYYADTLLRHIGGYRAVRQALTRLGVNPHSYRLADGSGLSRGNLASPRAMIQALRAMYYGSDRDIFFASLPVAGISGTLRHRMRETPAEGVVYAKTGTLRGVRTLSGYLDNPDYGTLVFSIMANQPNKSGKVLVKAIDEVVLKLSQASVCE